jgi:hypothetical protein
MVANTQMGARKMSEQTTSRQREERAAAATAAVWHYSGPLVNDPFGVVDLLNNPFPLPPGTVSVAADDNGFHVFFLE